MSSNVIKFKPIHDRILIRRITDEKTSGGIIITENLEEGHADKGEVVAVGTGMVDDNGNTIPSQVKVGDIVHFSKYVIEVSVEGEKLVAAKEMEILGVYGE